MKVTNEYRDQAERTSAVYLDGEFVRTLEDDYLAEKAAIAEYQAAGKHFLERVVFGNGRAALRFRTPGTVIVELHMEHHYEYYGRIDTKAVVCIPLPPADSKPGDDAYDEWAYDHIFSETGTGRADGDCGYFVTIADATRADMVGLKFEWGV
ncbi:hypothetical protein ACIA8K_12745 [Catenuloplanes sp. NPDC051500]|uniref:hypothetical protein n=1 Tax=Catenuloplanes sp. NPDC051500 TaxID=3363959 RepID=UPI00378A2770